MEAAGTARKVPQQDRSRQSELKLLDAAEDVLSDRGPRDFSLLEVAATAGMTTGTIYSRFKGKRELVRAVHERVMGRMDANAVRLLATDSSDGSEPSGTLQREITPKERIGDIIGRLATLLETEAAVLRALMFHAVDDKSIARLGAATHARLEELFTAALQPLEAAVPDMAATKRHWAFTFAYDVLARHLGLGHSSMLTEQDNWDDMLSNLKAMVSAYLLSTR